MSWLMTLWKFKSGLVAVKSMVMIPLLLGACLYGVWSCNSVLSTYKNAGALQWEVESLTISQQNATKNVKQGQQVAALHEQTSQRYYQELQSIEQQHQVAINALHERLLSEETGDKDICRNCRIP